MAQTSITRLLFNTTSMEVITAVTVSILRSISILMEKAPTQKMIAANTRTHAQESPPILRLHDQISLKKGNMLAALAQIKNTIRNMNDKTISLPRIFTLFQTV